MYKKSLAILLSVLMIVTSLISLFSFSASADSVNLVADGKFENGFSGWQVFDNTGDSSAAFKVVEEGANHVLSAASGLSMFKQVTLEAGVEYTVGFDFKFDTNAAVPSNYDSFYRVGFANSVAALGDSNFVGPYSSGNKYYNVYSSQRNDSNTWKTHTFTFTPTSNMTTYFVVGSYNQQGEANFFVDNVYLVKTTDLLTVTTIAGEGGSVSGSVKSFKGDSVTVKAMPSTGYELDGWYNAGGTKLSSDEEYTFNLSASVELTAKFKLGTVNPNFITNGNFAVQNLNDFEVFKNGDNSSEDFSFASFGEDYILSAKAGHSIFKKVDLKAGTQYVMSFDFRFTSPNVPATYDSFYRAGFVTSVGALGGSAFVGPNATGNKYYSIYPSQKSAPTTWKNHSFTFTPATDMSVYAVVGSYNHQGESDFELDNWILCKASNMITVNAVAEEGGTAIGTATVLSGKTVKLTATANSGYEFAGWYNGDVLVSSDAEYTHTAVENITLIAKFKSTTPISNYIVNGDFEKPFTTDTISNVSIPAVVGKWGKIYSGVARMEATETKDFTSADSAEKNGTRYITSGATKDSNQYIRAFGQYTNLPAGEYVLSFDAKSTVSDTFVVSIKKGQESIILSSDTIKYIEQSDSWKQYSIRFTVDSAGLYQIAFGGNTQGKGAGDFSIDNVVLEVYKDKNPNYIVNGDFEKPFTTDIISNVSLNAVVGKWGKIYSGVARMEATETKDFISFDSVDRNGTRYITSGATKDSNKYIRAFGQYVELTAGDYILEFDAKSTVANLFVVSVKKGQESINLGSDLIKYLDYSEEWQRYVVKFTADADGIYQIAFGGNSQGSFEGDFSIDNVALFSSEGYISVIAATDGGGKVTYPIGNQVLGSTATVIATADTGYIFAGWYKGNELVSADASYSFVVTESVELKAKFELDLDDDDAIIKNGKFDTNSTAGWNVVLTEGGSKASVVVDDSTGSAVAKTTGKGAVAFMQKVSLKANEEYLISFDFKFDDFYAIPKDYVSFYRSGFIKDSTKGLGNANFEGPNTSGNIYMSLAGMIKSDDKNAWNSLSYTFTPVADMETWFVIGAYNGQGVSNYSIDNVSIVLNKDATSMSVAAVSHGGSGKVTSSKTGVVSPGESVTVKATPNSGSVFGGWYVNGILVSDVPEYTHTVTSNALLYARFLDANNPEANQMMDNADFATGDLSGWGMNNIASATNTIEYVTENGESFVKLGESDMLYQPIELEPYSTYMIRVTTRVPDIKEKSYGIHDLGFFRFGVSEYDSPNVLQSGALVKDPYSYTSSLVDQCDCEANNRFHCVFKWGTYTYIYSNNSPDTVIANAVIGTPYCKSDLHIKKFEVAKYVDGIVDFESDILYGEDFFNAVKNSSFEEELSNDNWGSALPAGWSIKNSGKKGTNYLSVSGNNSKTYSFEVRTGATYVVAFNLRTSKAGTASVSIVDKNGNPWGDALGVVSNTAVFKPEATGKWQRMGAHLYVSDNPTGVAKVNIKISGGSNTLDIDEITVTKLGYATHNTNPNVYTDNSFDYENPVWYSPTMFYKLADGTTVDGAVNDPSLNGGADDNYSENANTGDYSERNILAVVLIMLPCALVMVFTAKRTDKNKKGGNL